MADIYITVIANTTPSPPPQQQQHQQQWQHVQAMFESAHTHTQGS
jgi:hypothetical protein